MIYTREKILNTQRLQRPRLWEKAVSDALHTATITVRNDIGIHMKNNTATVNSRLRGHLGKTEFILLSWGITYYKWHCLDKHHFSTCSAWK